MITDNEKLRAELVQAAHVYAHVMAAHLPGEGDSYEEHLHTRSKLQVHYLFPNLSDAQRKLMADLCEGRHSDFRMKTDQEQSVARNEEEMTSYLAGLRTKIVASGALERLTPIQRAVASEFGIDK